MNIEEIVQGEPRTIGRIYLSRRRRRNWPGWLRIAEIPSDYCGCEATTFYLPVRVRREFRRGPFRVGRNQRVIRLDNHRAIFLYHFLIDPRHSNPLGAIPRERLHGDLEQIVIGVPSDPELDTHHKIYTVTQLPFEEVYKFISAAAA